GRRQCAGRGLDRRRLQRLQHADRRHPPARGRAQRRAAEPVGHSRRGAHDPHRPGRDASFGALGAVGSQMRTAWVLAALAIATTAGAEPRIRLRLGTVAPNGSAWAHELTSMARELEVLTNGEVGVKWYMGGVAGGELEMYERIRKGQLDGMASGGMVCE